ncbi:copper ion binding protein [Lederbergia lenta]|uniref:Copper chaperone CopZ n=1 Tax=Lederbergia lenta TaxID=1467 RepID=A0A2X4WF34_LEDLE|nr:copper ion binding protein [Lederbergia lenta]MCM3113036.1 copper ion binding protein [Lederbergia lenta]MEC2322764.1 copper ion binding protein [Lederbergia lenta]SQI61801.1 MerTP family mercury (Hg2+) permease, binding protein MerP [Lederbergia lenta]
MKQVTLNVQGMSCGSCVNKIEGNIGKLKGVESVKVQLSDGKVDVTFNESTIKLGEIKDTIKNSGYGVIEEPTEKGSGCSCCH